MKRTYILALTTIAILIAQALPLAAPAAGRELLRIQRVDTSHFPSVDIQLGLTTRDKASAFRLWENGHRVKPIKVNSQVSKESVAVVLLMDISGSMKNKPIADAQAAAKLFIEQAKPADKISIIAFNSTVTKLAPFTNDKDLLSDAINRLEADGETAVFDGLLEALEVARGQAGAHSSVIVLSDGGDTASQASFKTVAELAAKLKIPVSVIALQSDEFNAAPLSEISRVSGGQLLTAVDSGGLTELYDSLAVELHNRYHLTYQSAAKTGRAEITIAMTTGDKSLRTFTRLTGLPTVKKAPVKRATQSNYSERLVKYSHPWFAAGLAFGAVFLLIWALATLFSSGGNILAEQLKYYDQLRGRKTKASDRPKVQQARDSLVGAVSAVSAKYDFADYAQIKLEQAGLPVKANEYITMHILAVLAGSLLAYFATGNRFSASLLAMIVVFGPFLAIAYKIEKRKAAFVEQMADTLDLIAGSLRAGLGLQQALAAAGREAREPTAGELVRATNQIQMGMSLEEALAKMAERIGDTAFRWVALAIVIHQEAGGNLAEILDNLAQTLRERQTLKRQVKALTAEGRLSAIILVILPFVEGLLLFVLNPGYMQVLITTIPGALMLIMSLALLITGAAWMRKIAIIEY